MDEQVLHDAGYRRVIDRWLKPLGPSLLVYEPAKLRWSQVFRNIQGEPRVYASAERKPDEPLGPWLVSVENYTARLELPNVGNFHFRTHEIEGSDG